MNFTNKDDVFCFAAAFLLATHINAAQAESACHFIEQASLDLSYAEKSTTPTVEGKINGKTVRMLLDTGASRTNIMRAEADRQNLNPERMREQTQGVGGPSSVFLVKVKDFAIGDAHAANLRFPVVEVMGHQNIGALIGADFLFQYDVELNLAENRVKLFRADHCQEKGLAYWDPHAMTVPMELVDGAHLARVQVKINGVPVSAIIDSGASLTVIDLSAARKLGFSTDAPGVTNGVHVVGIGAEKRETWNMTFDSFAIGDEVIEHPRMAVIADGDAFRGRKPFQMILGRDFLRTHRVMLAQSQLLFYYSYLGGQVFPARERLARTAQVSGPTRQDE